MNDSHTRFLIEKSFKKKTGYVKCPVTLEDFEQFYSNREYKEVLKNILIGLSKCVKKTFKINTQYWKSKKKPTVIKPYHKKYIYNGQEISSSFPTDVKPKILIKSKRKRK